jgi:hypothetical protein
VPGDADRTDLDEVLERRRLTHDAARETRGLIAATLRAAPAVDPRAAAPHGFVATW